MTNSTRIPVKSKRLFEWDTRGYVFCSDREAVDAVCELGGHPDPSSFAAVFIRFDRAGDPIHAIGLETTIPFMGSIGFELIGGAA